MKNILRSLGMTLSLILIFSCGNPASLRPANNNELYSMIGPMTDQICGYCSISTYDSKHTYDLYYNITSGAYILKKKSDGSLISLASIYYLDGLHHIVETTDTPTPNTDYLSCSDYPDSTFIFNTIYLCVPGIGLLSKLAPEYTS